MPIDETYVCQGTPTAIPHSILRCAAYNFPSQLFCGDRAAKIGSGAGSASVLGAAPNAYTSSILPYTVLETSKRQIDYVSASRLYVSTLPLLVVMKFIGLSSRRENEGPCSGGKAGRLSKNIRVYVFGSLSASSIHLVYSPPTPLAHPSNFGTDLYSSQKYHAYSSHRAYRDDTSAGTHCALRALRRFHWD